MSCFRNFHVKEEDGECVLGDGTICEECGYLEHNIHKSHVNNETLYKLINGEITYEEFISITKSVNGVVGRAKFQAGNSSKQFDQLFVSLLYGRA